MIRSELASKNDVANGAISVSENGDTTNRKTTKHKLTTVH